VKYSLFFVTHISPFLSFFLIFLLLVCYVSNVGKEEYDMRLRSVCYVPNVGKEEYDMRLRSVKEVWILMTVQRPTDRPKTSDQRPTLGPGPFTHFGKFQWP